MADSSNMPDDPRSSGKPPYKPPKRVPPPNHRALQDAVNRYAEYHGIAPNRVQRWVAFMALGAALSRLTDDGDGPAFLVKGGVSLELRLRLKARATKDYDVVFRGERSKLAEALDAAFATPYEGFTFRATNRRDLTRMTQLEIKVEYHGKVWSSIRMEASAWEGTPFPPEHVPAISLAEFGLKGPESLPCLPLTKQIAQKLHAMTEVLETGLPNDRVRDLLDVWALRDLVPPSPALREVCEETFRVRAKHPWPPEIVVHPHWETEFTEKANALELAVTNAHDAARDVQAYVLGIAAAVTSNEE